VPALIEGPLKRQLQEMSQLTKRADYGLDSPHIMAALCALGVVVLLAGRESSSAWRWVAYAVGGYFLLGTLGMFFYSKVGKLALTERLLDRIPWRGDERVLDVGCGRGVLTVAAAHRVNRGSVIGVDVWNRSALSGNRANSVLENAKIEGVDDKVEVREGDARALPFADGTFDIVLSNFVVHELKNRPDRKQMMREMSRVLKPGGHVALVDFVFTDDCVEDLGKFGVESGRQRDGFFSFWVSAILNFGTVKTHQVVGRKTSSA
jgi:ubiquinone/menaquinone biosynthesis C-methylase UbiE